MPGVEQHLSAEEQHKALRRDVATGLTDTPKVLPPKWFYDDRGSALFEQITALEEYYPTRTERALLQAHAAEIAASTGADTLTELGAGSGAKTRLLLDALRESGGLRRFVPVDVSGEFLGRSASQIQSDYPEVAVRPVVADFERHLHLLPTEGRRLLAMLGSTVGNLLPEQRAEFLAEVFGVLQPGESLLLGVDLVKDPGRLVAAYDDAAGVTAEFNRNVLRVINRELAADFRPAAFGHVARWDAEREWVEMRLRPRTAQRVHVAALDLTVEFAPGEEMRTEVSTKFRRESLERELRLAGLRPVGWWSDPAQDFALVAARR